MIFLYIIIKTLSIYMHNKFFIIILVTIILPLLPLPSFILSPHLLTLHLSYCYHRDRHSFHPTPAITTITTITFLPTPPSPPPRVEPMGAQLRHPLKFKMVIYMVYLKSLVQFKIMAQLFT